MDGNNMRKDLYQILGMLSAQFLLGMGLNVIGEPEADTATLLKVLAYILIALHVVLAFGILAKASQIWRVAKANPTTRPDSLRGLVSVSLAIVFGVMTVTLPGAEIWSFLMAAGFLGGFLSFGRLLLRTPAAA
jgi:hypothetical protein